MLRVMGIVCAAAAAAGLGFRLSFQVRQRLRRLRELLDILSLMRGEIGYIGSTAEEICRAAMGRTPAPYPDMFRELLLKLQHNPEGVSLAVLWEQTVRAHLEGSGLDREDLEIFVQLGARLGCLDVQTQLQALEYTRSRLEGQLSNLESQSESRCRMYQSLGILGALSVVVVWI